MRVNEVREVINSRQCALREQLEAKTRNGMTNEQVLTNDQFLAGQMYAMTLLILELTCLELEDEERKAIRR